MAQAAPKITARDIFAGASLTAKAETILEAAHAVFIDTGYERAGMDDIATRADASKVTVYTYFGSKDNLFASVMAARCRRYGAALEVPAWTDQPLAELLEQIGCRTLQLLMAPDVIALFRIVIAESAHFPDLGRTFYQHGPERHQTRLAEIFAAATRRGLLATPQPRAAAAEFIALLRTDLHLRVILGLQAPDALQLQRVARHATQVFLAAYGPASD